MGNLCRRLKSSHHLKHCAPELRSKDSYKGYKIVGNKSGDSKTKKAQCLTLTA